MTDSRIVKVSGRRVWDGRGRPAVEAEVALACGARGRAIAGAGAVRGGCAATLLDGGIRLGGLDVRRAVAHVNGEIAKALLGRDATDQEALDQVLLALDGTPERSRLGGNALLAASLASLQAAAAAHGLPLYAYLLDDEEVILPLPQVRVFGAAAGGAGRVDVQDLMVIPVGAASLDQALEWLGEIRRAAEAVAAEWGTLPAAAEEGSLSPDCDSNEEAIDALMSAIERAGLVPGEEVAIALDIAASALYEDGLYHLALDGAELDSDEMIDMLAGWLERYPIRTLENPLAAEDAEGLARLTAAVGEGVQIAAPDRIGGDAGRVAEAAAGGACNTILLAPADAGTVSEARAALDAARAAGWDAIAALGGGGSEDAAIMHLAVGWGIAQLKAGAFAGTGRMAKWNEGLRIEEAAGARARFGVAGRVLK